MIKYTNQHFTKCAPNDDDAPPAHSVILGCSYGAPRWRSPCTGALGATPVFARVAIGFSPLPLRIVLTELRRTERQGQEAGEASESFCMDLAPRKTLLLRRAEDVPAREQRPAPIHPAPIHPDMPLSRLSHTLALSTAPTSSLSACFYAQTRCQPRQLCSARSSATRSGSRPGCWARSRPASLTSS